MPFDPSKAYSFGDVVPVRFPFTNQIVSKQRPAVVVSSHQYNRTKPDLFIMAVTSQLRATAGLGEVWITHWQQADLLKPSAIKPIFATVEQSLIIKRLGALQSPDISALRAAISTVLQ